MDQEATIIKDLNTDREVPVVIVAESTNRKTLEDLIALHEGCDIYKEKGAELWRLICKARLVESNYN